MEISGHPDFDGHEMVIYCTDRASALRAFVAIHNTTLGPAMGGCRMKRYNSEADALGDALRLSRGMTYKYAASGLSYGGAKAVIIDNADGCDRSARLRAFARFVERLGGQYTTAEDAGIDTADVRLMSTITQHFRNLPLEDTGDGALCTAWGVFHGIQAGLEFRGFQGLVGRRVAVEGLGKVGMALCGLIKQAGGELVVYDIDDEKTTTAQKLYDATVAPKGQIHSADVDVYSPCALGAVLNSETIPEIRARIIAGAANNQLSEPSQDQSLWERGITYCPDYVVNAGGVLSVADKGAEFNRGNALKRVEAIRQTTREVLNRAHEQNEPTNAAADRLARLRLDALVGSVRDCSDGLCDIPVVPFALR
jgi:leucine dehydrogenase